MKTIQKTKYDSKRAVLAGLIIASAGLCAATGVQAADYDDFGRVLSVAPQVEQFNQPRQECRTEYVQVQRQQPRSVGGSIIGGIAGGLLGNQVGGGNGRTAATAAGAIAGAITGDRLDNNGQQMQQPSQEAVQQCRTVDHWESRTNGYNVTYEYHGRNFTSVLPYDPGQRVRLHVAVTPRP
jgi:uncharacterized protein YcfJ